MISLDGSFSQKPAIKMKNKITSGSIVSKDARLKLRYMLEKKKIEKVIGDKRSRQLNFMDEQGRKKSYVEELPEIRVASVVEA